MIKMKDISVNIGIVEAEKCSHCLRHNTAWYFWSYGYSYHARNGRFYNGGDCIEYGDPYRAGDIIDVCLDLRGSKNELSFAKNDRNHGKAATVKEFTDYKLAISMFADEKEIELLSFEMQRLN